MADGVIPWRRICCKDRWSGQCLISAFGFCRIDFREKRTAVCSPAAAKRHDLSLFLLYRSYIEAGAVGHCGDPAHDLMLQSMKPVYPVMGNDFRGLS